MRSPRQPPFLARKTYRRRRMMDAARLLPLLGIFLFLLPILWQPRLTPEPDTVHGVVYLFGAWTVLVIAARDSRSKPAPGAEPGKVPTIGEMAGHALDILFNDTLDADHERLTRVNETLSLLTPEALAKTPLKVIETLMLSPSRDLRDIAQDHAREMPVVVRHLLRSVGSWGSDGRLLSYLLFEPGYVGALLDLGYGDTMDKADDIRAFLGDAALGQTAS